MSPCVGEEEDSISVMEKGADVGLGKESRMCRYRAGEHLPRSEP